jgi:hypothetical protein
MPLASGYLLSVDTPTIKELRSTKGDPARRKALRELLHGDVLPLSYSWVYLDYLAGPTGAFRNGKSLHKGQSHFIVLLDTRFASALSELPDECGVRRAFLAIDEAKFSYRYVPFWVTKEWAETGVSTMLTAPEADKIAQSLTALRGFVSGATAVGRSLLFYSPWMSNE